MDVSLLGPDTIRVVLPEQFAKRMPEIRASLEASDELPVSIEPVE